MGLLEKLFPKKTAEAQVYSWFQTLGGYAPVYTSFEGGVYEMALTRACIHTFATHVSKLRPVVRGPGCSRLDRVLSYRPNPWMDTKKYLYRLATIYMTENTAFIAPVYDDDLMLRINGFYPVLPSQAEVVERAGVPYLRYHFPVGTAVVELDRSGIMTQMHYRDDFFGEDNRALRPTMELIHTQNQSIINGVKASGSVRFLAKLAQTLKPMDMNAERDRLVRDNLGSDNGGVMIFDAKYADVKSIESKPYVVDDKQAANIRESVFDYFGMSDHILHNQYTSDEWSSYYEGKIEPFAIGPHQHDLLSGRDRSGKGNFVHGQPPPAYDHGGQAEHCDSALRPGHDEHGRGPGGVSAPRPGHRGQQTLLHPPGLRGSQRPQSAERRERE